MTTMNIINYSVLWNRIGNFARKAGRVTARPVILLWYVLCSNKTPKADKMLILSTLSYLILPIDILDAKRLPFIGWLDEITSISICYDKVCKYITPAMEAKADALLDKWLPEYAEYVELPE